MQNPLNSAQSKTTGKSIRTLAREKSPKYQEVLKKIRALKASNDA